MQQEVLPARLSFQNPWTRQEFQGAVQSCTRFGSTSALEAMAHHAGVNVNLSTRYTWYYKGPQSASVQEAINTLNRVGTCREELCPYEASLQPPYAVKDIDVPPSAAAFDDAQHWLDSSPDVLIKRVNGKVECMRAMSKGSALITTRVNPSGTEHVEAAIGFDQDKGLLIHGSGYEIYWEPWESIGKGIITQTWAITQCPWPLIPHPDYVEGTLPTFKQGVLWLPELTVFYGYGDKPDVFMDATVHFTAANTGVLTPNDPDVGSSAMWSTKREWLGLPALMYFNPTTELWERWENVSLSKPSVDIVSFTKA